MFSENTLMKLKELAKKHNSTIQGVVECLTEVGLGSTDVDALPFPVAKKRGRPAKKDADATIAPPQAE